MSVLTGQSLDRKLATEEAQIAEIVQGFLALQARAAGQDGPLRRATHAKGVCVRAQFEVFDVTAGRDPALAARLAKGIYARPGIYPATVRFSNSDPNVNSDFKPDVRALVIRRRSRAGRSGGARCEHRAAGPLDAKRDHASHQ